MNDLYYGCPECRTEIKYGDTFSSWIGLGTSFCKKCGKVVRVKILSKSNGTLNKQEDIKMRTGIFIRAQVNGHWDAFEIGDPRLSDKQVFDWLRSRGGENPWAERVVMVLLGRRQDVVPGEIK